MPLLFLLAFQEDPRLDVKASLQRPRVSFAEFGAWVQNRTHVPITVAQSIRDRKATVLVTERPVGETMNVFAETFFLEWERTPTGFLLRLQPKVASEEATVLQAEAEARRANFLESLQTLMQLGTMTPERVAELIEKTDTDFMNSGDDTPEAKRRLMNRAYMLQRFAHDPGMLATGEALAKLAPGQRTAVIEGARLFASTRGGSGGIVKLSRTWLASLLSQTVDGPPTGAEEEERSFGKPTDMSIVLKGDPKVGKLWTSVSPVDGKGQATMTTYGVVEGEDPFDTDDSALGRRLAAWTTKTGSLFATKLRRDAQPLAVHSSSYHSLADLLVSLHRRSGLPIVADGFREAVQGGERVPHAADVKTWLDLLGKEQYVESRIVARTSKGWLLLRPEQYWRRLEKEIPERTIQPIERPTASLDDLAAFAAALTPWQAQAISNEDLVMDAPNAAVEPNVAFLRLWNSVPPALRRRAIDGELPLRLLPPAAQRLALEVLDDPSSPLTDPSDAILPYLLPGAPPLPASLVLSVEARGDLEDVEFPGIGPNMKMAEPIQRKYSGFVATIQDGERTFRRFELPLRAKRN